jgi:hypothetical protein
MRVNNFPVVCKINVFLQYFKIAIEKTTTLWADTFFILRDFFPILIETLYSSFARCEFEKSPVTEINNPYY